MSNFGDHPTGFFGDSSFYNGVTTNSLRFDKPSSAYLYRTPSDASNRRTFTIAFWYKTSRVFASEANDQNNPIFFADEPDGGGFFGLNISGQGQGAASDTVNELTYYDYDSGDTTDYSLETNSSFADSSAWYHIVMAFDTTQGTEANRVKVYINGVQRAYTDMNQHHAAVVQNRELNVNQATPHWIGRNVDTTSRYLEGYLADFNFIDGTQYDASYFGEFKNGVWIPKEPSVTYGTNGFRLQFKNTSVGSGSSSTIGADTSGNDNHFTSSGIAASDCAMPDSPENNFSTMNPLSPFQVYNSNNVAYANGNLNLVHSGRAYAFMASTFAVKTGKWYAEMRFNTNSSGEVLMVGISEANMEKYFTGDSNDPHNTAGTIWYISDGAGYYDGSSVAHGAFSGSVAWGDHTNTSPGFVIGLALDLDSGTRTITFTKDGGNSFSKNLTSNFSDHIVFANNAYSGTGGGNKNFTWNFGQDSTFGGLETATTNTDENGHGTFHTAPPSGYLALCSANLPELTIGPNSATQSDDYFDTLLYTGNSGSAFDVGGLGFKPDWVWIKGRSYADHHGAFDSSRGVGKILSPSQTNAEGDNNTTLDEFRSDGFGLGTDNTELLNKGTNTYVAWNWKANGGTATATISESGNNPAAVVQANPTAGFSIITYTGTSGTGTIAHGLGAVPKMIIIKNRGDARNWIVYHGENTSAPETDFLILNTNAATADNTDMFSDTAPTSSVFTIGNTDNDGTNEDNDTYVAYCFAEVEGYSKFGSYSGNGNADGAFVYTGFKPAWVMLKNTARGADWRINDITRQDRNNAGYSSAHLLLANSNSAEITNEYDIDFLSNGFKLRSSDVYENGSGEAFIYMAFAEAPFKYSNAH